MNDNNYAQESSSARRDAAFKCRSDTTRRRKRTTFTKAQLSLLEGTFSVTQYPNIKIKDCLADITGLPESKIQVWFQNRRARHFKSKKLSREASGLHADLQPEFILNARGIQLDPGLPSPPGYPAPSLPQSSRLSTIRNPDSSTSWHPRGSYQDHCSDFSDLCENVHTYSGLDDCSEAFLGDAHGSRLECSSSHPENNETLLQDPNSPQESLEDLSDLDLQDLLGDFKPSDLDISVAIMIDDLFGLYH
ncbi:homeobox protein SEBOX-like [Nematolebias whitei]|uniref:homeobox protein SEBOX-like n=1 Tax=Nematolebias whitei TaxID=451745 RepID=UPI00189B9AC2|nr:homeobox protein SEBOX-like [Nematolebias whitei]